jgi:hypothetical protein
MTRTRLSMGTRRNASMQEAARQGQMQRKRCEQTLTGRVKIATGGRKRRGGIFVPRDHHGIAAHDRFLVAPQLGGLVVAGGSDDIVGSRAHRLRATPTLAAIRGSCASRHGVGACLLPIQNHDLHVPAPRRRAARMLWPPMQNRHPGDRVLGRCPRPRCVSQWRQVSSRNRRPLISTRQVMAGWHPPIEVIPKSSINGENR